MKNLFAVVVLFAATAFGQVGAPGSSPSLVTGQEMATFLTAPLTVYVNGALGSDSRPCLGPGVNACKTIPAAIQKTPLFLKAPLTIAIAPYDAGYGGFEVPPYVLVQPNDGGTPTVNFYCESLVDASGLTGPVTGNAVSGTNTGGPQANWPTLTTTGGLVAGQLRGYLLEIVSGTGAGCASSIYDNTTSVITMTGPCSPPATFNSSTAYRVRDPVFIKSTVTNLTTIDAGVVQTAGIFVQSGQVQVRAPFFGAFVTTNNCGVDVTTSGSAVQVMGNGGFQMNRTRIINRSSSAASFGVRNFGGSVRLSNGYAFSGAGSAYLTNANTLLSTSSFTNMLFSGANSGAAGTAVNIDGSLSAVITNTVVRIGSNVVGADGLSFLGVQNAQLSFDVECAGSNNIGLKVIENSSEAASTAAFFNHMGINNCGTGMKLDGPAHVRIGASIAVAGTNGTLFDISHGARVRRQGTCTETNFTNYLNMDGNLWPTCAHIADAGAGTQGGDIMDLVHGTAWDSFP